MNEIEHAQSCTVCGAPRVAGFRFCTMCGSDLEASSASAAVDPLERIFPADPQRALVQDPRMATGPTDGTRRSPTGQGSDPGRDGPGGPAAVALVRADSSAPSTPPIPGSEPSPRHVRAEQPTAAPSIPPMVQPPTSAGVSYVPVFVTIAIASLLMMLSWQLGMPQVIRAALAALMVFALPGFVVTIGLTPPQGFSTSEGVTSSLGISLAIATCIAVVLGMTPIGVSGTSFGVALGGVTFALSVVAILRPLASSRLRRDRVEGLGGGQTSGGPGW